MANTTELVIQLMAKDAASQVLGNVDAKLSGLQKTSNLLKTAFSALTGVVASELVGALSQAANAGAQEAASQEKLRVAVQNTNGTWDAQAEALLGVVDAGMKLGFHDEELNDSLALLVAQTGSSAEAMERLQVAENLARGAHIDLYTASKLLGKATDENSSVLARYGVVIEKGATVTEMLAAVQAKFGGQAKAYGETTAGAIDRTKVSIEQWQAAIGNSLGPMQQYIALLPGMTSGMGLAGGAIGGATKALAGMTVTLGGTTTTLGAAAAGAAAAVAPFALVAATGVLVVEAFIQVKDTIQFVTDNWNTFIYALTNGKLNDIPVFGFFFSKIQQVLGLIQTLQNAWNAVTSIFSGASNAAPPSVGGLAGGAAYAEGTDYVPHTGMAMLHQGEAVIPAAQNNGARGATNITINVSNNLVGSARELAQTIAEEVGNVIVSKTLTARNLAY